MRAIKQKKVLSIRILQILADHYQLGTVTSFFRFPQGIINTNYVIKSSRGRFVLRFYSHKKIKQINDDIELMEYLSRKGFRCPKPIGRAYRVSNLNAACFKYINGRSPKKISAGLIRKVGQCMATLHRLTAGYRFTANRPVESPAVINKFVARGTAKILKSKFNRRREFVRLIAKELGTIKLPRRVPRGAIHFDIKPENVLLDSRHRLWLIDFDPCFTGAFILDIANAITWWCVKSGKINANSANIIIPAYNKVRRLDASEKTGLNQAIKFCLLKHAFKYAYICLSDLKLAETNAYYFLNIFKKSDL